MAAKRDTARTPPGPGVDAAGAPVVDPTKNVRELVDAANRRQDDLREMEGEHLREIITIRDEHAKDLRVAEAARLDAINAVNSLAVQQAAEVQDTRATALAGQVAASAEAMRSNVAATATAAATALSTALAPIITSIEQLRAAMWQEQGQKTQVVETQQQSANSGLWWGVAIAGVFGFLMFLLAALTLAAIITHGFTR
jgi:hypothetical protein